MLLCILVVPRTGPPNLSATLMITSGVQQINAAPPLALSGGGGYRREAVYTNLGPGSYTVHVTASNNDGKCPGTSG